MFKAEQYFNNDYELHTQHAKNHKDIFRTLYVSAKRRILHILTKITGAVSAYDSKFEFE